jgi:hypothetical protein
MIHHALDDASWLAIRQPAVVRLLEQELSARDGDAFAAGLELACRVLGGRQASDDTGETGRLSRTICDIRLDHHALAAGIAAVRGGRCDRAMVRSLREQIDALPISLSRAEEDAVATVIAAIIWTVLDVSTRELDDALVA